MRVKAELSKTSAIRGRYRVPKPNVAGFVQLFKTWGLPIAQLKKLSLHIMFRNFRDTDVRGEYMGYHNGVHSIELKDIYCIPTIPNKFLEEVTIHELRHVWWALQCNALPDLGENDCRKEEKKKRKYSLWIFESVPTT